GPVDHPRRGAAPSGARTMTAVGAAEPVVAKIAIAPPRHAGETRGQGVYHSPAAAAPGYSGGTRARSAEVGRRDATRGWPPESPGRGDTDPMSLELERRRVLIVAAPEERAALAAPFARGDVPGWEAGEAESFEQAHFLLQHDSCDVVLVDHSLYRPEDADGLEWLSRQQQP